MKRTPSLIRWLAAIYSVAAIFPHPAQAWGALGHRLVVETSALILERGGNSDGRPSPWGALLARHRFALGAYAYLPDSTFRTEDGNGGKTESLQHFFDYDLAKLADPTPGLSKFPRQYSAAREFLARAATPAKLPGLGTSPWRVEQLSALAQGELAAVRTVPAGYLRGLTATGDGQHIFQALFYLGVLSHYTGDAMVPYHATSDWNAWGVHQGGAHFFFESDCVDALEPELGPKVLDLALSERKKWEKEWAGADNVPAVLFKVYQEDEQSLARALSLDKNSILKPSGEDQKTPALRKPALLACQEFMPFLTERLARGAVLTSYLWQKILPAAPVFAKGAPLQFFDYNPNALYIVPEFMAPQAVPAYRSSPSNSP